MYLVEPCTCNIYMIILTELYVINFVYIYYHDYQIKSCLYDKFYFQLNP